MNSHVLSAFGREIEKLAKYKEPEDNQLRRTVGLGAIGGLGATFGLSDITDSSIQNGRKINAEEVGHFNRYFREQIPDVQHTTRLPLFHDGTPGYAPDLKLIYTPDTAHPAVLAHEMGHATGIGKHMTGSHANILHALHSWGPAAGTLAALAGTRSWALRGATKEERDKRLKKLQIASGLGGVAAVPVLAEEARASINAVNLGRKAGKGLEYARHLLPAFGTYAAAPVALTGATLYGLHKLRKANQAAKETTDAR